MRFQGSDGPAGAPTDYSETTAELIDDEVDRIVRSCYAQAVELLSSHRTTLDRIAEALRTNEVVDAKQLQQIMQETGATIASKEEFPKAVPQVLAPPPPVPLPDITSNTTGTEQPL